MSTPGVVLVGGGVASVAAARALRRADYDGPLVMLTDEPGQPYDRPPLSKQYLAGEMGTTDVGLFTDGELAELGVDLRCDSRAQSLDADGHLLSLDDGTQLAYQSLLVATGSDARRLSLGRPLAGVHYLRTAQDADALRRSLQGARRLVVIGAGFIGLEVAATARAAGLEVVVVEPASTALTRVLGAEAGRRIAALHAAEGVDVCCATTVLDVEGTDRVTGVLVNGPQGKRVLPADAVVVGVGAVPRTEWLAGSGVLVDDGVVCDDGGRTSDAAVYAAGDVSRWLNRHSGERRRVEQWQSAVEQGTIAGANIAADLGLPGAQVQGWSSVPYFWSDQYRHKLQFCGGVGRLHHTRVTPRGWVSGYGDSPTGVLRGVLAVNGPAHLARGRRHVEAGMSWPDAVEWLDSL